MSKPLHSLVHDLRNPLAVIRMAAYNIRRKCPAPDIAPHLDSIDRKLDEAQAILEHVLKTARRPPDSRE